MARAEATRIVPPDLQQEEAHTEAETHAPPGYMARAIETSSARGSLTPAVEELLRSEGSERVAMELYGPWSPTSDDGDPRPDIDDFVPPETEDMRYMTDREAKTYEGWEEGPNKDGWFDKNGDFHQNKVHPKRPWHYAGPTVKRGTFRPETAQERHERWFNPPEPQQQPRRRPWDVRSDVWQSYSGSERQRQVDLRNGDQPLDAQMNPQEEDEG